MLLERLDSRGGTFRGEVGMWRDDRGFCSLPLELPTLDLREETFAGSEQQNSSSESSSASCSALAEVVKPASVVSKLHVFLRMKASSEAEKESQTNGFLPDLTNVQQGSLV